MNINPFEGLPVYEGGKPIEEIFNCGSGLEDDVIAVTNEDAYMQIIESTSETEFLAYCRALENSGYTLEFSRGNAAGLYRRYLCGKKAIYTYYIFAENTVRIITEPKTVALASLDDDQPFPLRDTALMQFGLYYSDMIKGTTSDCGMMYVLRLRNNHLFVVDGGSIEQCTNAAIEEFMERIRALTGSENGEKIVIDTWFCTHDHNDHMDFFSKLIAFHADELELKSVMFNFPSSRLILSGNPRTVLLRNRIKRTYPDVKFLKLHTGMRFWVSNAMVEVLLTHEDVLPSQITDSQYYGGINETSTIVKVEFMGQSILFLGDTVDETGDILLNRYHGSKLYCTYLQAAHHCINFVENLYTSIKAEKVLVPQCRYIAEKFHSAKLKIINENYGGENVFFAGDCTRIFFTDGTNHRTEYYPVVGGSYDGSEV